MTKKQEVFINEYLTCWNATEAARRAGYAHPNTDGPRLLVNVGIKEKIASRLAESAMTADEVLSRLAEIARIDIGDFLKFYDGINEPYFDFKRAKELKRLGIIKKLKYNQQGKIEIEFYDKQAALVQMGKHLGLFIDRQQTFNFDMSQLTTEQLQRIANGEDPLAVITGAGNP